MQLIEDLRHTVGFDLLGQHAHGTERTRLSQVQLPSWEVYIMIGIVAVSGLLLIA